MTRSIKLGAVPAALAALAVAASPSVASARPATDAGWKVVSRDGASVTVPTTWPVVDLSADPTACMRLDVHAVYLGRPGPDARCPSRAVGRATTVQLLSANEAEQAATRAPTSLRSTIASEPTATNTTADDGRVVRVAFAEHTATESQITQSIRFGAAPKTSDAAPSPAADDAAPTAPAASRSLTTRSAATTQDGFETCEAPSSAAMAAWAASSPYSAAGIYIGGINRGCAQANLNAAWMRTQLAAGWSFIPTYVGRQAPCTTQSWARIDPAQAKAQGTAAAKDAIVQAAALTLGAGTPIYLDIEGYDSRVASCNTAVLAYISAWTTELHRQGYRSGVYSSAAAAILAMVPVYSSATFARPDEVWIARWNGIRGDDEQYLTASQWAGHRIHQYRGDHAETYGGVRLQIDSDFVHGGVARRPAGVVTPTTNLLVNPSWELVGNTTAWAPVTGDAATLATATAAGAHEGATWAQVAAPSTAGRSIAQDVGQPAHAGERWTFTAWVRSTTGTPVAGQLQVTGTGGTSVAGATAPFTAGAAWTAVTVAFDPYATFTGIRAQLTLTTRDVSLDVDDASLVRDPAFAPFSSWEAFVAQQAADFTGTTGNLTARSQAAAQLSSWQLTPTAHIQRQIRSAWFEPHVAPVARLYWAYFGRIPDAAGVRYWSGKHRTGTRLSAISQQFAMSNEFRTKTGSLSDQSFVARIYVDVLGRQPDPPGLLYWTSQLSAKRQSRGQVMVHFSESDEYRRAMAAKVNTFEVHLGMLQRSPTQAELATGAAKPTYLVIDGIRRGTEYGARVQ